jgi:hypothetical protein
MTERENPRGRPEEPGITASLRGLPELRPDPVYRERVRQAFVSGDIAQARLPARPGRFRWGFAPAWTLAPIAAAVLLLLFVGLNRGGPWLVMDAGGSGQILIDGHPVAVEDREGLRRHLRAGASIVVEDQAELVLQCHGVMVFGLSPGTSMTLPRPPGRWSGREVSGRLDHGEVRIMTGTRFPGRRLRMLTEDGVIQVTGTLVSIYKADELTCVCVVEGAPSVGATDTSLEVIPVGFRMVMFHDGSEPLVTEIEPAHRAGLLEFARKYR